MPKILEIKEIDGAAWVRIGVPGEFSNGVSLYTPDEVEREKRQAVLALLYVDDDIIIKGYRVEPIPSMRAHIQHYKNFFRTVIKLILDGTV